MTDLVQGILMIIALAVVLIFAFFHAGGITDIAQNLATFPRFTDFFGIATPVLENNVQTVINGVPQFGPGRDYGILTIISTMAWGLGYFGLPQVLIRFMAIKKTSMIRPSRNIAIIWCLIAQTAAVLIGITGRAFFPGLLSTAGEAETIFIHLSARFFPPLIAGIVISGVLAASMSSSDSYMLIVSSSLAHDIFKDIFKKDASDTLVLWVARITMLLVTVFAVIIAITGSESIFRVVSYAWAGLGASFGPLILFSLFWKRTTLPAALAGMLSGGIMVVVWKNLIARLGGIFAMYELLPAFVISSIIIVAVSLITAKPSAEIEQEFELAKTVEL
jgi:sodium/proline symporter